MVTLWEDHCLLLLVTSIWSRWKMMLIFIRRFVDDIYSRWKLGDNVSSDCNGTRTHNHLVPKRTSLVKWLSVCLRTKWLWVRVPLQSLKILDIAPVSSKELFLGKKWLVIPCTSKL